jgi:ketosteroid isomerase-like protein
MSDANVKLVRSLYDAFTRGDIATITNAMTPDVDWQVHGKASGVPTIGRWKGPKGAEEFFRLVAENQDATEFSPQDVCASGDKVFALGRYGWTVRRTGKHAGAEWCHVFTIKDGKVSQFREFTDTASFADAYRS